MNIYLLSIGFSNIRIEDLTLVVIGYSIVFAALVALFYVFNFIPKIINEIAKNKLRRQGKHIKEDADLSVTGEVNAAISTALFLYFNEIHDKESNVITIKRISRRYSPWSSKIYGLRNFIKP